MTKIASFLLLCMACVCARENPFEMADASIAEGKATQIEEKRTNFESATLKLPSSARILKSVSITFQNLDGSISEEVQGIDKDVDWHNTLTLQSLKNILNKPHDETPIALAVSTPPALTKKSDVSIPKKDIINISVNSKSNEFIFSDFIRLDINDKQLKILTHDTKVRDFLINDPYKVVVDFQRISSFATKTLSLQKAPYMSASLGNHDNFYRVAIALDGQYRYDIQKVEDGYLISLK